MGWLEWIGVGAGVLVLLAIIGYFIEKKEKAEKKAAAVRCPKCDKSDSVYLKDVKVVERYLGNKEVTETTSSGKSKTRFIKVMKVIEDETYACKNCDFTRVATVTRELD